MTSETNKAEQAERRGAYSVRLSLPKCDSGCGAFVTQTVRDRYGKWSGEYCDEHATSKIIALDRYEQAKAAAGL